MATILVAPLDWGLGHATRCVQIIDRLLEDGHQVVLGITPITRSFLTERYPLLTTAALPSYNVRYAAKGPLAVQMALQLPQLLQTIRKEHRQVEMLIKEHGITHVIADNRFGLHSELAHTVFITHQLNIQAPAILKRSLFLLNRKFIELFDRLWIPDFPSSPGLAGDLSAVANIRIPVNHTGPLSRFRKNLSRGKTPADILIVLSGPEPQRSILEQKLVALLQHSNKNIVLLRGKPGEKTIGNYPPCFTVMNHLEDDTLLSLLGNDTLWISRPGYSTLMDLYTLQHNKVLFIPTPGQTEQEYLAKLWNQQFGCSYRTQEKLETIDLDEIPEAKLFNKEPATGLLDQAINSFLG